MARRVVLVLDAPGATERVHREAGDVARGADDQRHVGDLTASPAARQDEPGQDVAADRATRKAETVRDRPAGAEGPPPEPLAEFLRNEFHFPAIDLYIERKFEH